MRARTLALIVLAALVLLVGARAEAIPAFARKYETGCQTCHAVVWPKLNPFGRQFKENGYQYPDGAEESYRAEQAARVSGGAPLDVFRVAPLSVRGRLLAVMQPVQDAVPPRTETSLTVPTRVDLLGGGSVFEDVSVFGGVSLGPNPYVHHFAVGLHNLGAPGLLNVRAGRFMLLDFQQPAHRNVTALGNPAAEVRFGGNPFALDDHHEGVHVWGRPQRGRFFYEAAVLQGVADPATGLDADLWKDVYGRVTLDLADHRVGVFGYLGNTVLTVEGGGITRRFQDPHSVVGVEGQLELPWLTLFGYVLRGHHANPFAIAQQAGDYQGVRLQADV
ncbi:MAG: hypothetical protein ACK4N5_16055, partial [Myxococcales bacterium]